MAVMCAGMMGTIPSDIRSGLLELFYGVYEKVQSRSLQSTSSTAEHLACPAYRDYT